MLAVQIFCSHLVTEFYVHLIQLKHLHSGSGYGAIIGAAVGLTLGLVFGRLAWKWYASHRKDKQDKGSKIQVAASAAMPDTMVISSANMPGRPINFMDLDKSNVSHTVGHTPRFKGGGYELTQTQIEKRPPFQTMDSVSI